MSEHILPKVRLVQQDVSQKKEYNIYFKTDFKKGDIVYIIKKGDYKGHVATVNFVSPLNYDKRIWVMIDTNYHIIKIEPKYLIPELDYLENQEPWNAGVCTVK